MKVAALMLSFVFIANGCGSPSDEPESDAQTQPTPSGRVCEEQHSRLIGRLYYVANPVSENTDSRELESFVINNRDQLMPGSRLLNCAANAGNRLRRQSVLSFSKADADQAYQQSLNWGATQEQAQAVSDSMIQGSIEGVTIGEELLWLSKVIPAAARGDWDAFKNTGTDARQETRQAWRLMSKVINPSDQAAFKQAMQQFQPWLEYQIAFLVYRFGN